MLLITTNKNDLRKQRRKVQPQLDSSPLRDMEDEANVRRKRVFGVKALRKIPSLVGLIDNDLWEIHNSSKTNKEMS